MDCNGKQAETQKKNPNFLRETFAEPWTGGNGRVLAEEWMESRALLAREPSELVDIMDVRSQKERLTVDSMVVDMNNWKDAEAFYGKVDDEGGAWGWIKLEFC